MRTCRLPASTPLKLGERDDRRAEFCDHDFTEAAFGPRGFARLSLGSVHAHRALCRLSADRHGLERLSGDGPFYEHVAQGMKAKHPNLNVWVEAIALREHEKRIALGLTSGEPVQL